MENDLIIAQVNKIIECHEQQIKSFKIIKKELLNNSDKKEGVEINPIKDKDGEKGVDDKEPENNVKDKCDDGEDPDEGESGKKGEKDFDGDSDQDGKPNPLEEQILKKPDEVDEDDEDDEDGNEDDNVDDNVDDNEEEDDSEDDNEGNIEKKDMKLFEEEEEISNRLETEGIPNSDAISGLLDSLSSSVLKRKKNE